MQKTLLFLAAAAGLSGCQVTGERGSLYQNVLGGFGPKTQHIQLNPELNSFSLTVPLSAYNELDLNKGLISNAPFFDQLKQDRYWSVHHIYDAQFRRLAQDRVKIKVCNTVSADHRRSANDSNSCADIQMRVTYDKLSDGVRLTFKPITADISTEDFGFFIKNAAPELFNNAEQLNTATLIKTFGYEDALTVSSKRTISSLRNVLVKNGYTITTQDISNEKIYLSLFELKSADAKVFSILNCRTAAAKNGSSTSCKYALFSPYAISDYRIYSKEITRKINQLFN
mgnify:CR=1 FL=1